MVIFFCTLLIFKINTWSLYSDLGLLQTLTDILCKELGKDDIRLKSKVLSLSYSCDGKSAFENWSVSYASDHDKHSQGLSVDAVIITVSIHIFSTTLFAHLFAFFLQSNRWNIIFNIRNNVWFIYLTLLLLKLMQLDWVDLKEIKQE